MNRTLYDNLFLGLGLLIQIIVYYFTGASILSLISGVCGIVSVVLCSQRNVWFYFWGFAQLFTYIYLCISQNFYGEIAENIFYAVTMIGGIYVWLKHKEGVTVIARTLSTKALANISAIGTLATITLWGILMRTDDKQPFMDAVSTVPAIIAQFLCILRYREQWIFWLIIDVASIIMWAIAGNWIMSAQFAFWTINCIYGYRLWGKSNN